MCTAKLFVMCIVVCITDVCQAQTVPTAEYCAQNVVLSTNKAIYRQDDTLKAACVLPSACYRYVDDVILQLADSTLPVADTVIGNTTITLTSVYTIQTGDAGKHIRCVINSQGTAAPSLSAQEALTVAEPPAPVDEIKCIVFSYQTMNCSFWPEHQDTGIPTTYDIYYQHQFFQKTFPPDNFRPCPDQKGNACIFSGTNFYRLGYYAIFVLARNELGNANKTAVFNAAHNVKLERINTLRVTHSGKTWLDLSWEKPYPDHILENTTYEITVHSSDDPRPAKMRNITSDSTYLAFNVTDLIPYIQYIVIVRSFPWSYSRGRLEYGGYWSDPAIVKLRTLADVPGAAPNVTAGGFLYDRVAHRLDLHWQPVPLHLIHGEPMHYRIRLFKRSSDEDPSCDGDNPVVWKIDSGSFSTNQTVHLRGPFDVCIDLANHIGYNENLHLTAIRISKEELPVPKFYTRLSQNDQTEVRILEDTNASRYTLFWCKSFVTSCVNKELHWMLVNSSETTPTIVTDLPVRNLAVALSAEYVTNNEHIVSSGMKYATHLFKKAFFPIQMPRDLKSINSKAGSATIQWKKPNKVDTVYIDHFTVDYCLKDNCIDPGKHKQVSFEIQGDLDGTQQTESLFDLAEEQIYKIRVRSDGDGKNSNYTDPIEVMVHKSGLSKTWKIVLAVIGAVTVIPVVGIVYTVIRKCRKTVVEYNRPLDVIVPTIDEQLQEQNGHTTRSADQYADIADDGYEKIQEGQSDNNQQEEQEAAKPPSGTSVGKVNAGAQPEEVALLDKQPNGHVTPQCSVNSEYRGSALP